MNKVSIIIPIYNTEKYLTKCLDSVINQTYKNLEIILVNDGSSDNSLEICKMYQKNDNRIKIINKENSGVSDSRNLGIDNATGEYLMFLDSDDYLSTNIIDIMYKKIKNSNADIVTSGMKLVDEDENILQTVMYSNKEEVIDINNQIDKFVNAITICSCINKLYKKELIKDIRFDNSMKYGEDLLFSYSVMKNAKNIRYIPTTGYYYLQNEKSASHNLDLEKIRKYMDDNLKLFNTIRKDNIKKEELIENRLLVKANFCIKNITKLYKYNQFRENINYFINCINFKKVNISRINNVGKIDKISIKLLIKKKYFLYYIINKLNFIIKR